MPRYIVFEPPAPTGEDAGPSDRAVLVRDAMATWAILFPFVWLFRYGLILAGFTVLAAGLALGLLAELPGLGIAALVLPLALGLLVALEGPSLRAARYRRRGWREVAVVEAENEAEATILYYGDPAFHQPAFEAVLAGSGLAAPQTMLARPRARSLLDPQGYQ